MKYYVINESVDWADEFDVLVFHVLTEEERKEMMNKCKAIIKATKQFEKGEWKEVAVKSKSTYSDEWNYYYKEDPSLRGSLYFGSNEGWDNEEYSPFRVDCILQYFRDAKVVPEDAYKVLKKYAGGISQVNIFELIDEWYDEIFICDDEIVLEGKELEDFENGKL